MNFFFIHKDAAKDESDLTDDCITNEHEQPPLEYEVDELSESEDLESHDTSSGTDVSIKLEFLIDFTISFFSVLMT